MFADESCAPDPDKIHPELLDMFLPATIAVSDERERTRIAKHTHLERQFESIGDAAYNN